jgi:hypothetical protein
MLPAALADCDAAIPDSVTAAAQLAFVKLARMHAENRASESWVLDKVSEIVLGCDGAAGVRQLPLGRIFDLSNEWGYRSRPERTRRREIRAACRAQLATAEATPPPPLLR